SGVGPASLETPLHLAIYRARPDAAAICRTYSRYAGIMGATNQRIEVAHGLGGMLGRYVPVHPDCDLIVDDPMAEAAVDSLGQSTALLLRGNGALATGSSLERAVVNAILLEEAAMLCVLGAPLG